MYPHIFLCVTILSCASAVRGGAMRVVNVGSDGTFYDPSSVTAEVGDTVRFVFVGPLHEVVQGSFENPCLPLPGGFSSGPAGSSIGAASPIWDLLITNASTPIWFFCGLTVPTSHCATGMVGAINPPNISAFNQYRSAAQAVSNTPVPTPTVILVGQGASATAPPNITSASVSPTLSAASAGTTSLTPIVVPSAAVATHTSPPTGAIVGGVIGGIAVLAALTIALVLVFRRRRAVYSPYAVPPAAPGVAPGPAPVMSVAPFPQKLRHEPSSVSLVPTLTSAPTVTTSAPTITTSVHSATPGPNGRPLPRVPLPALAEHQPTALHSADSGVDLDVLAREVAQRLHQQAQEEERSRVEAARARADNQRSRARRERLHLQNNMPSSREQSPGPPRYR